jgi:Icc protein
MVQSSEPSHVPPLIREAAMLIAQISDLHIREPGNLAYGRVDTASFLGRCVDHLLALDPAPDIVVATGDLVDGGQPGEYEHLRRLLAPLPMPVFLIPGNHDEREALRTACGDRGYFPRLGFLNYVVEAYPVRLVALDTVIPGEARGTLCEERLAWLDRTLAAAPERPTIVLMHHPPFATGIAHMDALGLDSGDRLAAVIADHRQVERILCGHLHRSIQVRFARTTLASTAPSTAHQVALDLRGGAPAQFVMEPPGYQLHLWRAETGIVSHTVVIGEFPGPFPFAGPAREASA